MPDHERTQLSDPPLGEADVLEVRMREAEAEVRAYLERAKARAGSLVAAMEAAIQKEAEALREHAEQGISARRQQAELDAGRQVEEARMVAERMVAERQRRLAALSDGISDRARRLTNGMEDADRLRRQFDSFVRALSATAGQVARDGETGAPGQDRSPRRPAIGRDRRLSDELSAPVRRAGGGRP